MSVRRPRARWRNAGFAETIDAAADIGQRDLPWLFGGQAMQIPRTTIVALAVLFAAPNLAHGGPAATHRGRPRIEVTPEYHFYRACLDGYRLVRRPEWGETVIMPYMHCHWVRGASGW